jgi:hypothetical protein
LDKGQGKGSTEEGLGEQPTSVEVIAKVEGNQNGWQRENMNLNFNPRVSRNCSLDC